MTAKDYMIAISPVGDRRDTEIYYKDIVIEFEETPNKVVTSVLKEIIPDLTSHNDSKVFEYHYSNMKEGGYGTCRNRENNDNYKNIMLVDLIIRLFETYNEGQHIDLVLQ